MFESCRPDHSIKHLAEIPREKCWYLWHIAAPPVSTRGLDRILLEGFWSISFPSASRRVNIHSYQSVR